jgi:hypothetical protein
VCIPMHIYGAACWRRGLQLKIAIPGADHRRLHAVVAETAVRDVSPQYWFEQQQQRPGWRIVL